MKYNSYQFEEPVLMKFYDSLVLIADDNNFPNFLEANAKSEKLDFICFSLENKNIEKSYMSVKNALKIYKSKEDMQSDEIKVIATEIFVFAAFFKKEEEVLTPSNTLSEKRKSQNSYYFYFFY